MGPMIKHTTGVDDSGKRVIQRSQKGDGRASCNEFSEEIGVGFEGVTEHESVDLEEVGSGFGLLEKRKAFSLYWTPKRLLLVPSHWLRSQFSISTAQPFSPSL